MRFASVLCMSVAQCGKREKESTTAHLGNMYACVCARKGKTKIGRFVPTIHGAPDEDSPNKKRKHMKPSPLPTHQAALARYCITSHQLRVDAGREDNLYHQQTVVLFSLQHMSQKAG
jgi:hypothetical protein